MNIGYLTKNPWVFWVQWYLNSLQHLPFIMFHLEISMDKHKKLRHQETHLGVFKKSTMFMFIFEQPLEL